MKYMHCSYPVYGQVQGGNVELPQVLLGQVVLVVVLLLVIVIVILLYLPLLHLLLLLIQGPGQATLREQISESEMLLGKSLSTLIQLYLKYFFKS